MCLKLDIAEDRLPQALGKGLIDLNRSFGLNRCYFPLAVALRYGAYLALLGLEVGQTLASGGLACEGSLSCISIRDEVQC